MKKLRRVVSLCLAMCLCCSLSISAIAYSKTDKMRRFTDVDLEDSNIYFMNYAVEHSLFFGTSWNTYGMRQLFRCEAVTVLGRIHEQVTGEKMESASERAFPDIEPGSYYARYVAWAKELGILQGISEDNFLPKQPITWEDFYLLLHWYLQVTGRYEELPKREAAIAVHDDIVKADPCKQEAIRKISEYSFFVPLNYEGEKPAYQLDVWRNSGTEVFVRLHQCLTYPRDSETPRVKYACYVRGQSDKLWNDFPLQGGEPKLFHTAEEYRAFAKIMEESSEGSLGDERISFFESPEIDDSPSFYFEKMDEGAPLALTDELFEEYNLVALLFPLMLSNEPNMGEIACAISGNSATVTFVDDCSERSLPPIDGYELQIFLYLIAVPKNVHRVTAERYGWVGYYLSWVA